MMLDVERWKPVISLLNLLKDITPQNISVVPKDPYCIPSELWDAAQEQNPSTSEFDKLDLMEMIVLRTKKICELSICC